MKTFSASNAVNVGIRRSAFVAILDPNEFNQKSLLLQLIKAF